MTDIGSPVFSNEFGAVFADRIAFNAKKGWFGGGSTEELPIRHVTSVRMETSRKTVLGVILGLVGLALLVTQSPGPVVVGLLLLAFGAVLLMGWPQVTVNTSGNDLRVASGGFWQKDQAEAFVSAVKKVLFDKQS